jgi:hypothetical protein
MIMLPDAVFFVDGDFPERRKQLTGGLVVCGLNFGARGRPVVLDEIRRDIHSSKTFLEPRGFFDGDPLRLAVAKRLQRWGWDLERNPELDQAILPTNCFYNFTNGCSERAFRIDKDHTDGIAPEQWDRAVERLVVGASAYRPSGYLVIGMSARDAVARYLAARDSDFSWKWKTSDLCIGQAADVNIAITRHYSRLRGSAEQTYIESISDPMTSWLAEVKAHDQRSQNHS